MYVVMSVLCKDIPVLSDPQIPVFMVTLSKHAEINTRY